MSQNVALTGLIVGRWTVIGLSTVTRFCKRHWVVECACGTLSRAIEEDLLKGKTTQCRNCRQASLRVENPTKTDKIYNVWCSMKARCYRVTSKDYARYGGRGIKVCDRWRESYAAFCEDMGPRPEGYSLDRIDNSGNYCPENCRWAPVKAQNQNKRNNVYFDVDGQKMCLADACRHYGITGATYHKRIKNGWEPQKAISTPGYKRKREMLTQSSQRV
jgi:hypothetical protein